MKLDSSTARNKIFSKLLGMEKVSSAYLDNQNNIDVFTITIEKEYDQFSLELSTVYWELYDDIDTPSYHFEFEYFIETEVPSNRSHLIKETIKDNHEALKRLSEENGSLANSIKEVEEIRNSKLPKRSYKEMIERVRDSLKRY